MPKKLKKASPVAASAEPVSAERTEAVTGELRRSGGSAIETGAAVIHDPVLTLRGVHTFNNPVSGLGDGWEGEGTVYTKRFSRTRPVTVSFTDRLGRGGAETFTVNPIKI